MRYSITRMVILLLITADTWLYGYLGDQAKLLDSAAWLLLMLLFEAEKHGLGDPYHRPAATILIRIARGLATLLIFYSNASYLKDADWLDIINSLLWYGVIIRLEVQARWPVRNSGYLYVVLSLPTVAWLWQGALLDAWDAVLWILALMVIDRPGNCSDAAPSASGQCDQSCEVVPAEE